MSLIVETGAGLATAESYVSVADADAYFVKHPHSAWSGSPTAKENALRIATQYIDAEYGGRWLGRRYSAAQRLDWPRNSVVVDGYTLEAAVLPPRLIEATCEAAARHLGETAADSTLAPDVAEPGSIASESVSIGPISTSTSYAGGRSQRKWFVMIELLLQRLTLPRGQMERA